MENRDQKKRKTNHITITPANDDDVEFELPVEIIQHIQSKIQSSNDFMGEIEAARTILVSKSWYRAWSTRPDIVFNRYYDFPSSRADMFWEFARTTIKRYEDHNLNIRSLKLVMPGDVSLAIGKELIVKAIKFGVVDLTIQNRNWNEVFVLPHEVLQSQTLARLYLRGSFNINPEKEKVTCYNLKSLKLKDMDLNDDFLRDMISRCPLIKEFTLGSYDNTMDDEFLDKLPDQFLKLEYLYLRMEYASPPPRHDLWAKFACIKELKIVYYGNDDLRIRIPSLELINITLSSFDNNVNVEFDFPNIRKFKMRGCLPRRFELKTSTTGRDEWVSKIVIDYIEFEPSDEWFNRLSQFLRKLSLSRSRVSLTIYNNLILDVSHEDDFTYSGDGLAIPIVEKLKLIGFQVTPAFLNALFWSCRPKFVEIRKKWLFDMKKVNVEVFQQLRSLPWETIYHASSDEYSRIQLMCTWV